MAQNTLIQCTDCMKEISRNAKICPHCGAGNKKADGSFFGKALLIIIFLIVMNGLLNKDRSYVPATSSTSSATNKSGVNQSSTSTTSFSNWHYRIDEDHMNSKKTYFADTVSTNTINFDFPYQGEQSGILTLRTHPRYGKDIMLSISQGQFLCRYDGCSVLVRFDDSAPVRYGAAEPADNDTTTLFLSNYSGFVSRLMKAKRVRIEAQFYREGSRIFEFDVRSFDANQYLGK